MMTLEQLLDNYRTYRDAFEVVMEQLQQADDEIEELSEENKKLDEENRVLIERLIVKDCECIKLARRIRKLVKELAKYRGEEI